MIRNSLSLDLLKRHAGPFMFCFFTIMFLLLMQFLILHVDNLIGKDIPILVIIELITTNLAYMVVLAAPMAVLVATLMAFGRFSELNELTALRSSGINPIRIIQPVLITSVILFAALAWFSNEILPEANNKARSLFIDIRLKKPGFELKPNVFYNGIEGYTFLVKGIDPETDSLQQVTLIQDPTNNRDRTYIKADRGLLKSAGNGGLTLFLHDGEFIRYKRVTRTNRTTTLERSSFDRYRMTFDLTDLSFSRSDPNRRGRSDRTMSAQAMAVVVDTLQTEISSYRQDANAYKQFPSLVDTTRKAKKPALSTANDNQYEVASSSFIMLENAANLSHQRQITAISQTRLEDTRSSFENTQTNITWRLKRINKYLVEIHKKLSIPFACIVFVLLGAPLGIMTRKGNFGYAAIISTVILTIYWISIIQGEKLADRLFISPFWGMWSFNILFSLIGIILLIHLSTGLSFKMLFRRAL